MQRKPSKMTSKRIKLLNAVDFVWKAPRGARRKQDRGRSGILPKAVQHPSYGHKHRTTTTNDSAQETDDEDAIEVAVQDSSSEQASVSLAATAPRGASVPKSSRPSSSSTSTSRGVQFPFPDVTSNAPAQHSKFVDRTKRGSWGCSRCTITYELTPFSKCNSHRWLSHQRHGFGQPEPDIPEPVRSSWDFENSSSIGVSAPAPPLRSNVDSAVQPLGADWQLLCTFYLDISAASVGVVGSISFHVRASPRFCPNTSSSGSGYVNAHCCSAATTTISSLCDFYPSRVSSTRRSITGAANGYRSSKKKNPSRLSEQSRCIVTSRLAGTIRCGRFRVGCSSVLCTMSAHVVHVQSSIGIGRL